MRELQEIEFVLRVKLGTYKPEDIVAQQDELGRRLGNVLKNIIIEDVCVGELTTEIRGKI